MKLEGVLEHAKPAGGFTDPDVNGPVPDLDDPQAVNQWIKSWLRRDEIVSMSSKLFQNYTSHFVAPDGRVNLNGSLNFESLNTRTVSNFKHRIPLNFRFVSGSLICRGCTWIESFDGFPEHVGGTLNVSKTSIASWDGCPTNAVWITLNDALVSSLSVEACSKLTVENLSLGKVTKLIKLPLLGLIEDLEHVIFSSSSPLLPPIPLVNDVLKRPASSRRERMFELQQALIDAGFEAWADI